MIEIDNILDVEKHIEDIKVVVFDLDDTLYSEKEYVKSGYKAIAEAYQQIENCADRLWTAFNHKQNALDIVFEEENLHEEIPNAVKIYREHKPNIHLYLGVRDMLKRIKQSGKILAMITDGRPNGQRNKLDVLGLNEIFDYKIITDELGGIEYRKPNSKAFELVKDKYKTEYQNMCYIGDNKNKDFIAPMNLGIKSIYFKNKDGIYC